MNVFIVIPAFNEAKVIGEVIHRLKARYPNIIVVDDGSSDRTATIAEEHGAYVYKHMLNRGLGGALGTGIAAAIRLGADIIVTFDADGQHAADDIVRIIEPIERQQADFVIGSRLLEMHDMPFRRRLYNTIANAITYALFGVRTTDSQSGLRAMNRHAAKKIRLRTNKMEVSSEFMKEIHAHQLRFIEIPIKPIYTTYSMSKGQNFLVGIKTFIRLIVLRITK